jgi:Flp pilus assembly protein TadD
LKAKIVREAESPTQALLIINDFVQDHWWHAEASMMLGALCLESGDRIRAEKAFSHASVLDVHDASALNQIALIYVSEDQLEAACKVQHQALAREPDQPRQYLILAGILNKMGRAKEAAEAAAQAHRLMEMAKSQVAVTKFP